MSYEIPQELEYKEKIVFNLNFEQLLYLVIFGFVILTILFKTNLNMQLKIMFTTLLGVFSVCFMFFNLKQKINDFFSWYKFREFKLASFRMKQLVPEINIQNNVLEVKNGKIGNIKSKTN